MRSLSSFCDFFVITSGSSIRQVHAIAQAIRDDLSTEGIEPMSRFAPGDESGWLALDYRTVVAHVFHKPLREFYALENLWSDAKKVKSAAPRARQPKKQQPKKK
jgi:ribosome-associated protein